MKPVTRYQANDGSLWDEPDEALERDRALLDDRPWPRETTVFLRADRGEVGQAAEDLGIRGEALRMASHAVSEVACKIAFDDDGAARLVSVTYGSDEYLPAGGAR